VVPGWVAVGWFAGGVDAVLWQNPSGIRAGAKDVIAAHLARCPHPYRRFCGCGALLDDFVRSVAVERCGMSPACSAKVSVHFIIKFVTFVFLLY